MLEARQSVIRSPRNAIQNDLAIRRIMEIRFAMAGLEIEYPSVACGSVPAAAILHDRAIRFGIDAVGAEQDRLFSSVCELLIEKHLGVRQIQRGKHAGHTERFGRLVFDFPGIGDAV